MHYKRVRDSLHGTIELSKLETLVIDHPYFQRLRRINQTGFLSYAFPCATHSRFEHSLGAMHLAGLAWDKLRDNQLAMKSSIPQQIDLIETENLSSHGFIHTTFAHHEEIFSERRIRACLRVAALLHDVGHSPFSHSGEVFLPRWIDVFTKNSEYPTYLQDFLQNQHKKLGENSQKPIRHEFYSLLLTDKILRDIYLEHPDLESEAPVESVAAILHPSIHPGSSSFLVRFKVLHLCHEIVSGEVDVDRMDYLLRDARECGVVYGVFDLSRVMDSLVYYEDAVSKSFHLGLRFSGLAAFEDYLRARQSMYLQLYFHKTSTATDAMLKYIKTQHPDISFPLDIESFAELDDGTVQVWMKEQILKSQHTLNQKISLDTWDQLTRKRKLWKRVFEISSLAGRNTPASSVDQVATRLKALDVPMCVINSTTSLTRLSPRSRDEPSKNKLRIVKKDEMQVPRLLPIEDVSLLAQEKQTVAITRIYAPESFRGSVTNSTL